MEVSLTENLSTFMLLFVVFAFVFNYKNHVRFTRTVARDFVLLVFFIKLHWGLYSLPKAVSNMASNSRSYTVRDNRDKSFGFSWLKRDFVNEKTVGRISLYMGPLRKRRTDLIALQNCV
jgi:hypothetical protein